MLVSGRATTTPKKHNSTKTCQKNHDEFHIPDWIFQCRPTDQDGSPQTEDHPTDPGPTVNPNKMLGQRQSDKI